MDLLYCAVCEKLRLCEYHHTIPASLGGDKTIPLCTSCQDMIDRVNMGKWDQREVTAGFQELFTKYGPAGRLYLLKALKLVAYALVED